MLTSALILAHRMMCNHMRSCTGTIEVQDCEWLWPKYNLLLKQLRALHEKAQADLVRKVAAKKHFMSALQITNPTGYDMVHKIFNAKPNKVTTLTLPAGVSELCQCLPFHYDIVQCI